MDLEKIGVEQLFQAQKKKVFSNIFFALNKVAQLQIFFQTLPLFLLYFCLQFMELWNV